MKGSSRESVHALSSPLVESRPSARLGRAGRSCRPRLVGRLPRLLWSGLMPDIFMRDRAPVSTYDQALWWLIGQWAGNGQTLVPDELPPEALLVADMFWVTERQLRADLAKHMRETFPTPRVRFGRPGARRKGAFQ